MSREIYCDNDDDNQDSDGNDIPVEVVTPPNHKKDARKQVARQQRDDVKQADDATPTPIGTVTAVDPAADPAMSDAIPPDTSQQQDDPPNPASADSTSANVPTPHPQQQSGQEPGSAASAVDLAAILEGEKQKRVEAEEKLKRILADMQNLQRRAESDVEKRTNYKVDKIMLDFLAIYDDLVRARAAIGENKAQADGLDSILKSMDALLQNQGIVPIDALGEIFDPSRHEAISVITDPSLDDDTITTEIRKGYISHERVLRPTLVEISKKESGV